MSLLAVVPVRDGVLPAGADEAVAEAGGAALLIGDGTKEAAAELLASTTVAAAELGTYRPGTWAAALAPVLRPHHVLVLPASPDGRDLAPRIAHVLDRPLLAGATEIDDERIVVVRHGGLVREVHRVTGPVVATLVPGVRGVEPGPPLVTADAPPGGTAVEVLELDVPADVADPELLELVPPDPATVDLAEARRIVAGGAGLGGPELFPLLEQVAVALGASYGATRVASDFGWAPHDRYIGTTGVTVDPDLYIALAISGAVQHVTGLGQPDHIISVNLDPSAPMMAMADLAVVTDARALLHELARRLEVPGA